MQTLDEAIARKVLTTVDAGLVGGLGKPVPGQMSVEAAVCYAYGLPHSDKPPCVGTTVRAFKIRLNDSRWSSNEARTKGMRRLAVAQLGSDVIDQAEFRRRIIAIAIREMVPIALRAVGCIPRLSAHRDELEAAAVRCETEGSCAAAIRARDVARRVHAAYAACADAAAYAYDAADDAACAVAYAADVAAAYAACGVAYAACAADAAAAAVAYAADADAAGGTYAAADDARARRRDGILTILADRAVEVLQDLGSPGCQYLWLCDTQ